MIEPVSKDTALAMCKRGKQLSIGQRFWQQSLKITQQDLDFDEEDDGYCHDDSDEPY